MKKFIFIFSLLFSQILAAGSATYTYELQTTASTVTTDNPLYVCDVIYEIIPEFQSQNADLVRYYMADTTLKFGGLVECSYQIYTNGVFTSDQISSHIPSQIICDDQLETYNNETNTCDGGQGGGQVPLVCESGEYENTILGCVEIKDCSTSQELNYATNTCEQICDVNELYNDITHTCHLPEHDNGCPIGEYWDNGQCYELCPAQNQYYDWRTDQCAIIDNTGTDDPATSQDIYANTQAILNLGEAFGSMNNSQQTRHNSIIDELYEQGHALDQIDNSIDAAKNSNDNLLSQNTDALRDIKSAIESNGNNAVGSSDDDCFFCFDWFDPTSQLNDVMDTGISSIIQDMHDDLTSGFGDEGDHASLINESKGENIFLNLLPSYSNSCETIDLSFNELTQGYVFPTPQGCTNLNIMKDVLDYFFAVLTLYILFRTITVDPSGRHI